MRFILSLLVLLCLCLAGLRHVWILPKLLDGGDRGKTVRENFVWRLRGVTVGGGFDRWILCRRRINDVYVLPGGQLLRNVRGFDPVPVARKLLDLDRQTKALDLPFLFVQLPAKELADGKESFPRHVEGGPTESQDRVLEMLQDRVVCADVRPLCRGGVEEIGRCFLKTDHHWNFETAFRAFQRLMPLLLEKTSAPRVELPQTDRDSWKTETLPRAGGRYLGSLGRRTGPWCVGYECLDYLVPAFDTDLRIDLEGSDGVVTVRNGSFAKAILNTAAMADPDSCYVDCGYDVYLGDQARVEIRNDKAPVRRTLFVVKDSFAQPLVAWLSTVFTRIVAVDVRMFKRDMAAEIGNVAPDLVMVMTSLDWVVLDMNLPVGDRSFDIMSGHPCKPR